MKVQQVCRISPEPHCVGNRLWDCDPIFENIACAPDTIQGLLIAHAAGLAKPEREYLS
ncbi:hypothetical protein ACFLRB_02135 [Acidobacteriota bacterium]